MTRPKLLDLFCGAGGCSVGYHRAGFDVTGVDINPQPNYPYEFHQGDAMTWPLDGFDAIAASPPCHDHSTVTGRNRKSAGTKGTGWMLKATIDRLRDVDVPWVVENVGSAVMPAGIYVINLCGSSFGLDVRRHRKFASNVALLAPQCQHGWQTPRFRSLDSRRKGALASVIGVHGHLNYPGEGALRNAAMGIDWMSQRELTQAIPPAYTEHIGAQLLNAIEAVGDGLPEPPRHRDGRRGPRAVRVRGRVVTAPEPRHGSGRSVMPADVKARIKAEVEREMRDGGEGS